MERTYFKYGNEELSHLRARDPILGSAIDTIGPLKRAVIPDLFTALVHSIVGQQISSKAHETIFSRILEQFGHEDGTLSPRTLQACNPSTLQQCGLSHRKVSYIQNASKEILLGTLNLDALHSLPDDEVKAALIKLNGIGPWTAEMLLLLSMERPNILSYLDLGIRRGISTLYGYEELDTQTFHTHYETYSPYASVASLYLWAVSAGALNAG